MQKEQMNLSQHKISQFAYLIMKTTKLFDNISKFKIKIKIMFSSFLMHCTLHVSTITTTQAA